MSSLPKYLREEAARALTRAAVLTQDSNPSDARWFETTAKKIAPGETKKRIAPRERVKKTNLPKAVRARRPKIVKMTNSEIFAHNHERAKGICECGCELPFEATFLGRETMDHYDNGRGKDERGTTANTWNLRWGCHQQRQEYVPSVVEWNRLFREHCERNEITPIHQHLEHAEPAARIA